jgi:hypothetical protein
VERDLRRLFLDNPWRDPALPALVHEDGAGRCIGFLGVVPRPMSLGGLPLRAAVSTRLMVDGQRPGVAMRLLQAFLAGPQDLSLADEASATSRALWERLGGTTAVLYSLDWVRPIAPAAALLGYLAYTRGSRALEVAARAAGRLVDGALRRAPGSPLARARSPLAAEELSDGQLLERLQARAEACALGPCYTPATLGWLLRWLEERLDGLRRVAVRDGAEAIGWYVYGLNRQRIAQVVQLAAAPRRLNDVLGHLVQDAAARGGVALLGRAEPRLLGELDEPLCVLRRAPWVLVHARSSAVLDVIARGDALLGRLEGEWWMPR